MFDYRWVAIAQASLARMLGIEVGESFASSLLSTINQWGKSLLTIKSLIIIDYLYAKGKRVCATKTISKCECIICTSL